MPLWEVTINKQIGAEGWTNVYWVDAPNLDAAVLEANDIVLRERSIHYSQVLFTSHRVSDGLPGTDIFRITPIGATGDIVPTAQLVVLFNTLRVDFGTTIGRPSRKYLRGCLIETDVEFDGIGIEALARAQNYANLMVADDAFVDVDGQPIVTGVPASKLQMRQLRRGSKRRIVAP